MPDQTTADGGPNITTLIDGEPFVLDECESRDLALAERYVGQGYLSWDWSSVLVHQACVWLARKRLRPRLTIDDVTALKVGELSAALDWREDEPEPAENGNGAPPTKRAKAAAKGSDPT
jgi:hypothetical protein